MPRVFDNNGGYHYYITDYDGPWQVCSNSGTNVTFKTTKTYKHGFWYILNTENFRIKIIGPVKMKGVNYFDRAREEAKKRNQEVREILNEKHTV